MHRLSLQQAFGLSFIDHIIKVCAYQKSVCERRTGDHELFMNMDIVSGVCIVLYCSAQVFQEWEGLAGWIIGGSWVCRSWLVGLWVGLEG